MFMTSRFNPLHTTGISDLSHAQLARLMDIAEATSWSPQDAVAALRHQLQAPLWPDLDTVGGQDQDHDCLLLNEATRDYYATSTFSETLTSNASCVESLELIKRFGRQVRDQPSNPLCGGPGTVLYFAAIAAALVFHDVRITTLSNVRVIEGLTWSLGQPGTALLHEVFEHALNRLFG